MCVARTWLCGRASEEVTSVAEPARAGQTVFGPGTLDEGHGFVGLRTIFTKPEQRSDATLEALAGEHIHAHNTDYNLNASVGVAYGITTS